MPACLPRVHRSMPTAWSLRSSRPSISHRFGLFAVNLLGSNSTLVALGGAEEAGWLEGWGGQPDKATARLYIAWGGAQYHIN